MTKVVVVVVAEEVIVAVGMLVDDWKSYEEDGVERSEQKCPTNFSFNFPHIF